MRLLLLALGLALACGHSSAQPDASVFVGRPGDLGSSSPVIDHSGPDGGLTAPLQSGAIGDSWQPANCPGTVPVAIGVSGAAWGANTYGTTDKSPHAVHTSFRFDTSTSFAVIWETDNATQATFAAYGDSPTDLDHFVQGVTFSNPPDPVAGDLPYPLLVHEVHVCGLQPNRTYYFAVGGDGWYGNVYPIVTAPPVGATDPIRFIAMGDSNFFYSLYAELETGVSAYAPAFTLFTGDMIHDGTYQSDWEQWFAAGGPTLASIPTMTVHGNHEELAVDYFALFALPGIEEIYSFDYGNIHFVVLNDSPAIESDLTTRQAAFLDADLTAAESRATPPAWTVTSHHRPMFSSDPQQGSDLGVRSAWQGILEKHHVDVDFNGHSHHYESTLPILGQDGGIVDAGGIRYMTVGGAGALFDPPVPTPNPWTIVYYANLSLAVIDVTPTTFTIQGRKADGSPLETTPIVLQK
jgi:hypothetical protein